MRGGRVDPSLFILGFKKIKKPIFSCRLGVTNSKIDELSILVLIYFACWLYLIPGIRGMELISFFI